MKFVVPVVIGVLALVGLADSVYLSLAHYGVVEVETPVLTEMCEPRAGTCESVQRTSQATTLGVPNSMLGVGYYMLVAAATAARLLTGRWFAPRLMLALTIAAMCFSIYLLYVLVFQIRVLCPYCMLAHAINIALVVLYALSLHT